MGPGRRERALEREGNRRVGGERGGGEEKNEQKKYSETGESRVVEE